MHPVRDRDGQAGGGRGVGVLVGGDVHARRARALDARCGVPDLSPVLLPGRFVVRELHAHLRAPADLDVLFDRIEELRALVADVAGVEPALRAHHLAERGELVCRAERARRVDEARGETDRPLVHRPRQQAAHIRELGRRRRARLRPHDARAQRPVPHERADVDRRPHLVDRIRVLAEGRPRALHLEARELAVELRFGEAADRRGRAAAVTADDERDAHVQRALERAVYEHGLVRMRVDVDETRRDDAAAHLDDPGAVRGEVVADRREASAANGHVGFPSGGARPVDDRAAAKEQVGGHAPRRSRPPPRSRRFATMRSLRDFASTGFPS